MENPSFTSEFEFKASQKMLFPYLNTPGGLSQWFADDVTMDEDKVLTFFWDEEAHKARISSQRLNKFVRFEFLNGSGDGQIDSSSDAQASLPYIEILLENNELTGTVFMVVTDTATSDDQEEAQEIWQHLTESLREIVGG
ncbi:MAG: START-like domain-containing protein [Cyclobacteriaceae bacterium]